MNKKMDIIIKKVSSDEPNVSKRHVTYDVYHNGKYHTTFKDINDAMDHKEKMQKEEVELDETVLNLQQRQKRAQIMRRYKSKIERAREMAKRKMAPEANIKKRAYAQARQIIRRRVAGTRGAEYEKLGPSEKMIIDRAVEGKQKIIKKLALRLIPRVKQAEAIRLHSFMKGQQLHNLGQPEGNSKESSGSSSVSESLNTLFKESFPPSNSSTVVGQRVDVPITSSDKKMPPKGKSKNNDIIQHNKFQEELENNTNAFKALFNKAENSNIDLDVLGEVYNRGWNAWTEDCRVSQQQYAFARVNSFINQGRTYFNEDSDLQELSVKTLQSFKDKADDRDTMLATNKIRKANKAKEFYTKTGIMTKVGPKVAASNPIRTKARKYTPSLYDHTEMSVDSDLHEITRRGAQKYIDKARTSADDLRWKSYGEYMGPDGDWEATPSSIKAGAKAAQREKMIALARAKRNKSGETAAHYTPHAKAKVKATNEAREPGKPSVTRYKRPDGTTALKSLNKWGKRKDWQDTEGGLKKAREHSKSDLSEVSSDLANRAANKAYQASHRAYDDVEVLNRGIRSAEKRKNFNKADDLNDKAYSLMSKVDKKERQGDKFSKYAAAKTGVKEETITSKHAAPTKGKVIPDASIDHIRKIADHVISRYGNGLTDRHVRSAAEDFGVGVAQLKRHIRYKTGQMKTGRDAYQVHKEEVQQSNENFIDGKGPGKPGDAARHGLKGKSATELRKIRSSETTSPRKKQLAHWMLNMHHNESVEEEFKNLAFEMKPGDKTKVLRGDHKGKQGVVVTKHNNGELYTIRHADGSTMKHHISTLDRPVSEGLEEKRGLWDNIHAKRKRIKAGSGERMRKPGSEGAPTKQNFRDASESIEEGYDVNDKHYKALTDLDLNTKNRDMTTKHDGYGPLNPMDVKGSKAFWDEKAKMWNTTVEAAMEARCGNCAAFNQAPAIMKKMAEGLGPAGEKIQDLSNLGFCELFEFKCAGSRTCNKWLVNGPITEEDTGNGTNLLDKLSKNSKARKKIEVVDRRPPHTEYTRQAELQRKIIENHPNCGTPDCCGQCDTAVSEKLGNTQNDPNKRLIGTSSLVKAYKKDTPGEGKKLNDAFSIAFETGRDGVNVIKEREVEEEVRTADIKGVIVRTADGKTILRKQKVNKKIIGSGNVTDGKPDDTV